jgi:hypothetical protein
MSMMLLQQQILQPVLLEEEQHLQRTCWLDIGELFHIHCVPDRAGQIIAAGGT